MTGSARRSKRYSVWPSVKPGKNLLADAVGALAPTFYVELSAGRDLDRTLEEPSLTVWDAAVTLRYGIDAGKRGPAVIATACCWVVDRSAEEDWEIALLDHSREMASLTLAAGAHAGPFTWSILDNEQAGR